MQKQIVFRILCKDGVVQCEKVSNKNIYSSYVQLIQWVFLLLKFMLDRMCHHIKNSIKLIINK